jgi:hypothetical protein
MCRTGHLATSAVGGHVEDVEAMGQRGCLVVDLATCFGEVERRGGSLEACLLCGVFVCVCLSTQPWALGVGLAGAVEDDVGIAQRILQTSVCVHIKRIFLYPGLTSQIEFRSSAGSWRRREVVELRLALFVLVVEHGDKRQR